MTKPNPNHNKPKMLIFENEDSVDRCGVKPILNDDIWSFYKNKGLPSVWFVEDVLLTDDISQWESGAISPDIKHFVKYILSFFHGADKLVAENLGENFSQEVNILEAQMYYRFQAFVEDIHSDMYSTLIEALIKDKDERDLIFNAISDMPVIKAKSDWVQKYSERSGAPLPVRLVAFAVVEGLFFSGSFCAIYYLRDMGILPGLCFSNDYIARDEGQHCEFAVLMYNKVLPEHRIPQEEVYEIFREAVAIETEFVTEAIPVSLIGMNSSMMEEYIKFVADFWLVQLGYEKLFGAKNPFSFMVNISIQGKTNFFEKRVGDYKRANVGAAPEEQSFAIDDDF